MHSHLWLYFYSLSNIFINNNFREKDDKLIYKVPNNILKKKVTRKLQFAFQNLDIGAFTHLVPNIEHLP